jgi:hypothetical protein
MHSRRIIRQLEMRPRFYTLKETADLENTRNLLSWLA